VVIAAGRRLTTTGSALAAIAAALLYFAPVPAEAACGRNGVTLYQTYWCPYCRQVRQLFARHGVRFRIVEISNNPSAQAIMIKKFGSTGVPWTVIDGVAVPGYDAPRLKQLLCVR
jgi:glutaredoxin